MEIYKHLDIYLFEYLDTRMNTPGRGVPGGLTYRRITPYKFLAENR